LIQYVSEETLTRVLRNVLNNVNKVAKVMDAAKCKKKIILLAQDAA